MIDAVESLARGFERGQLGRREFVQGVLAVTAAAVAPSSAHGVVTAGSSLPPTTTAEAPRGVSLNHVSLAVSDISRSQAFYERVLGATEVSRQPNGVNLGLGESFLGLYDINPPPRIHHFCVGVEDYEIERSAKDLRSVGVTPRIRQDRPELYFEDPDGVTVQLSPVDYRG